MDFCKYVNPFYGNFEPELPTPNETASKWFFLKAQVGNTTPAAVRPFGMMSACAYTGGYPTGYGPYLPNSHARPAAFLDRDNISALGFSHFHQSGTGYIGEFYNYSIITPTTQAQPERFERFPLTNESAEPGFYSCKLGDVACRVTVNETAAIYSFEFSGSGNSIVFDPVLNGIFKDETTPFTELGELEYACNDSDSAKTSVRFSNGLRVHTAVKCSGCVSSQGLQDGRIIFKLGGSAATVRVGASFADMDKAVKNLSAIESSDFDTVRSQSNAAWSKALSKVKIDADDGYKTKFYSNLYRSFIKPISLGNNNGFGMGEDCYCDLATLWDLSKTHLPLIFTLFDDVSTGIVKSFIGSYKRFGLFPNSVLLNGCDSYSDDQARALAVNSVYDAYLRGVKGIDWDEALSCMIGELDREVNSRFHKGEQVSDYPSHTIDLAVAAYSVSQLARELGKTDIAEKYARLSENWITVYDKSTGAVDDNGKFYEGCNLNYSFRLLPDMAKRVEVAGGKERFEKQLDEFFGFDKEPAVQCLNTAHKSLMLQGEARRGFEGFNNETDMETPYNYCYIGRYDKACDIVRSGEKYMYGSDGRGALCGNEDSGAMSSLYVVNALGLFPCFGQDSVILGSPAMSGAEITLSNSNTLRISVDGFDENGFVPKEIYFNGDKLSEPFITVKQLMNGGEVKFIMQSNFKEE